MISRWILDDMQGSTYTLERNPDKMGSLYPPKVMTIQTTTFVGGTALFFQGNPQPQPWSFSGTFNTYTMYEALRFWTYNKDRVKITDHYNRLIYVVLTEYDPIPAVAIGQPWYHTYDVKGLIYNVDVTNVETAPVFV